MNEIDRNVYQKSSKSQKTCFNSIKNANGRASGLSYAVNYYARDEITNKSVVKLCDCN